MTLLYKGMHIVNQPSPPPIALNPLLDLNEYIPLTPENYESPPPVVL